MSKRRNELRHLTRHTCGNWDCKLYGKIVYKDGKCPRCSNDRVTWEEYEYYEKLFGAENSDAPSLAPTTYIHVGGEPAAPAPSDVFSCPTTLTGCPVAAPPDIRIPHDMYLHWVFLCRQFDTEWIAYLQGKQVGPNSWEITGMTFPQQEASGAHVSVADGEKVPDGTIAAVHSHVNMAVFFSQEDEKHFNHRFELVVNRSGDIVANGLSTLECGRLHRGTARALLVGSPDQSELRKQLEEKLTRGTTTAVRANGSGNAVQKPTTLGEMMGKVN